MKKLLILCLTAGAACGSDAVDTANHFDGFYFGLGANLTNDKTSGDIEVKEQTVRDDVGGLAVISIPNQARFDRKKQARFGGSAVLGYRVSMEDFVVGIEGGLDVVKNKTNNFTKNISMCVDDVTAPVPSQCSARSNGITPSIAFVAGWKVHNLDGMLFAKLGVSRNGIKYIDPNFDQSRVRKINFISPFVGLGFEKHLGDGFGFRIEGDVNLKGKKSFAMKDGYASNMRLKNNRINIRLLLTKSI